VGTKGYPYLTSHQAMCRRGAIDRSYSVHVSPKEKVASSAADLFVVSRG
jgi:hypothetical protein